MKNQQIIRPNKQEAYFRTQDNFEYSFNDGDSRGILPLSRDYEAKTEYKKIYNDKRNWVYSIPVNFVVVNINEIDVNDMEYALLDNNRAIVLRKDYYKFKDFSLNAQFEMWVVSEYTDIMTSYPDFYHVLKRKISKGQGYEFLKNFYIREREFYQLCRYDFSILESEKLVLEYKDKLSEEILCLKVDLEFAKKRSLELDKKIRESRKRLSKFSANDPGLRKKLDSLIRKQEKLIEKSIVFGDQSQRELDLVNEKIEQIGNSLEDSEAIRQGLLNKIGSLESQHIESLELCSSLMQKITSLEDKVVDMKSGIQDVLENEGYFIRG
jgi:hypothetical protein